jgi:TRAP transporter TAXI family solute receptor
MLSQRVLNLCYTLILAICVAFTLWWFNPHVKTETIHLQTASVGGFYQEFGLKLQRWVKNNSEGRYVIELHNSQGSVENREALLDQSIDFAIIDAGPVKLDKLTLVAPLWREYVHLIKRVGSPENTLLDFSNKGFILGNKGSGYRAHSELVSQYYGLNARDFDYNDGYFEGLTSTDTINGALVTTSLINPDLMAMLYTGKYELLPVQGGEGFSLKNRRYHAGYIPEGVYASQTGPLPHSNIETISSWATMVTHSGVPTEKVEFLLKAIFSKNIHRQVAILENKSPSILPGFKGIDVHPSSEQFFDPNRGLNLLTYWFDLLDQIKNFIFVQLIGLVAGLFKWRAYKAKKNQEQNQQLQYKLYDTLHELLALEKRVKNCTSPVQLRSLDNKLQGLRKESLTIAEKTKITQSDLLLSVLDQSARVAQLITQKQSNLAEAA